MNILFLSELFYPNGGGAELASYLYARLLASKGFNVTVITNKFSGEEEYFKNENLTVYRLSLFRESKSAKYSVLKRFDILLSTCLHKMMKWADIIYIPRFWYSAIPVAKNLGKPVIVHLHDYIVTCPLANLYDLPKGRVCERSFCSPTCIYSYERSKGESLASALSSTALNSTIGRYMGWLANLSDALVCVSEAQRKLIAARAPLLSNRLHVIYNPLPEVSYVPLEGDDFAYFGGSSPLKGFHVLYEALKKINDGKITVEATGFPVSKNSVSRLLNGISIEKYGWVRQEVLEKIYRSSRAIIIPSLNPEPLPFVTYEALLRGRLVIASNIGGIPEQTNSYLGCFLFPPGNHEKLASILQYVSSMDREEVLKIGQQNRSVFLSKNQNQKCLDSFIKILKSLHN
jgi:glycosyltransferase involved in cell wall biosynthesis